jgi:hypothetical protein
MLQQIQQNDELKKKGFSFLKKNWLTLAAIILALLLIRQCNQTSEAEKEAKREHNNYLAERDSVRFISNKLGNSVYEKSAFELKMSELSKENKDLIAKLDLSKKKTPEVVIHTVTEYVDIFKEVPAKISQDSSGKKFIDFLHNPKLPGSNALSISGKIPYELSITSLHNNISPNISIGNAEIKIEQRISIVTGLYRDPKSKRLMTRVSTDYPGISFSDINSFQISDTPENRKTLMGERKRFGIGINGGFGYVVGKGGFSPGAFIGVGIHFSPKFLQFDSK